MSVKFWSMGVTAWPRQLAATPTELPGSVFRYALATSGAHQLLLLGLTVSVFLLEVVPLELQRRIVNDLEGSRLQRGDKSVRSLYWGGAPPRRNQARSQRLSRLGR